MTVISNESPVESAESRAGKSVVMGTRVPNEDAEYIIGAARERGVSISAFLYQAAMLHAANGPDWANARS